MNNDNLKKLYEKLVSDGYDMPDYQTFLNDMSDETKLKKLYNSIKNEYNLPDFNTFKNDMGLSKDQEFVTGIKGDVDKLSTYPKCVRFSNPVKLGNIWSIPGKNDYEGLYFYNNGKYWDSKKKKIFTYSCDEQNGIIINDTPTNTSTPTTSGSTSTTTGSSVTSNTNITGDDVKNGKLVKIGMKGDIVGEIQKLLIGKKFTNISKDGKPDNIFGNRTYQSVKGFQKQNGLKDDGIVGPKTYIALLDGNSKSNDGSTSTTTSGSGDNPSLSHDCSNKDFPFEFGCRNPKISELQKCLGIEPANGVFGPRTFKALYDDQNGLSNKIITKELYDKIIQNCKK